MRKGQQKCFSKSNFDRFLMGREAKAARPASPALQPHPSLLFRSPLLLLHYSLPFSSSTSSSVSACLSFELSLSVRGAASSDPPPVLPRSTPPPSNMTTFSPYTDNPSLEPNVVFPRPEMQALSAVICALY